MRLRRFIDASGEGLALYVEGRWLGLREGDGRYPGNLDALVRKDRAAFASAASMLAEGGEIDIDAAGILPPFSSPEKIICIGLNYVDHSAEAGFAAPTYPTVFARWSNSLISHGAPIIRPVVSTQLDFEGEIAAIIGERCRNVARSDALRVIAGYSIFNDASVRDYQFKSPQWTMGKCFDGTGAFGPDFVTADEAPLGMKGASLVTRLNGEVVQSANTTDMVFDMAALVAELSVAMTLDPGDVIVSGTPAGVGMSRKPPLWMKPGDIVEVEVEGLGILRNPVVAAEATPGVQPN